MPDLDDGWRVWDSKHLPTGLIWVMYTTSEVFPKGAICQAAPCEVAMGVLGDKNPTYWKPAPFNLYEKREG